MFSAKFASWLLVTTIALLVLCFIPTLYTRVVELGTDTFEAHEPVFGESRFVQSVTLARSTKALGVIAVNLRRTDNLPSLQVRVLNQEGVQLAATTINPSEIRDDMFAWARLSKSIPAQQIILELASPEATSKNALGIRMEQETRSLALATKEVVPLWQRVLLWRADNPDEVEFFDKTIGASVAVFILLWVALRFGENERVWKVMLIALVIGTLILHIPAARSVEGVFGGDAFNFLAKTRAWLTGADPFAADPRKAPLLLVFLLPAFLGVDAVWWGRVVGMASAGIAASVLAAMVARLGLPRVIALSAGLLLATNREFWWESIHGLSNVPYAALIVISVFILLSEPRRRRSFRMAVAAGLTFLMRYEGALVGAILLPTVWIRERVSWKGIVRAIVVAAIIAFIPFSLWFFTGNLGVRTAQDIADDPGLSIAWSFDDYANNIDLFRLFWGRLWLLVPLVGWQFVWLVIGVVLVATMLVQKKPVWLILLMCISIGVILVGETIGILVSHDREARKQMSQILTFISGIGVGWLLIKRPKWIVPVLLMLFVQIGFVTAILPKTRYYVQVIPFAALALAVGVYAVGTYWRKGFMVGVMALLIGLTYADATTHLPGRASGYNANGQKTTVLIKAGRALRHERGNIAIGEHDLPLHAAYADVGQLFTYPAKQSTDTDTVIEWLNKHAISKIVETSSQPLFVTAIESHPALFEQVLMFDTKFGEAKAWIYEYRPQ